MKNNTSRLCDAEKTDLYLLIAQGLPLSEVVDQFKKMHRKKLTVQAVSYHAIRNADKIDKVRVDFYKQRVFTFPIAHKGYRIQELQKLYNQTGAARTRVNILKAARAELGEDIEKLAEAIGKSGGDQIVNIVSYGKDSEDGFRLDETAEICGYARKKDRF